MLLTIDYLILNFKGKFDNHTRPFDTLISNPFHTIKKERGNAVFKDVYEMFYCDKRVGVLNCTPHSQIIDAELVQFQFQNDLFYQSSLSDLKMLVTDLVNYYRLSFAGVNRLDIAVDTVQENTFFPHIYTSLLSGSYLLKGREKHISAYNITKKGRPVTTGFTVGKRSSARFLRAYNKTVALSEKNDKPYITEWHESNGLKPTETANIWRFEYQLNNSFFQLLREQLEVITWQVFDYNKLLELFNFARNNHFDLVYNTGRSEINKEQPFEFLDFSPLEQTPHRFLSKIKRVLQLSTVIHKRLCKSLFRQYYGEPSLSYLYPLLQIIKGNDLIDWFYRKYEFYVREFQDKEKIRGFFNECAFWKILKQQIPDHDKRLYDSLRA